MLEPRAEGTFSSLNKPLNCRSTSLANHLSRGARQTNTCFVLKNVLFSRQRTLKEKYIFTSQRMWTPLGSAAQSGGVGGGPVISLAVGWKGTSHGDSTGCSITRRCRSSCPSARGKCLYCQICASRSRRCFLESRKGFAGCFFF